MPAFFIRDCSRCGTRKVQHMVCGQSATTKHRRWEVMGRCSECGCSSLYGYYESSNNVPSSYAGNIEYNASKVDDEPVRLATRPTDVDDSIPDRVADLFREANGCRQMGFYDAAGSMYRKTLDVSTKHIYASDPRLSDRAPANNLRPRIKALGEMGILGADIVELADVAALDGNDATHEVDPYTDKEAEALEDLTIDLLDRLFVRPARLAEVKAKQIASGQRKAD